MKKESLVLIITCLLVGGGCGSVERNTELAPPLKLLHLYPRDGESNVPREVQALAVFSHPVFTDNQCSTSPLSNKISLHLQECGQNPVDITLDCYRQRDSKGKEVSKDLTIVVLSPKASLQPETRYCIFLSKELTGLTSSGTATEPLGADINAYFKTSK